MKISDIWILVEAEDGTKFEYKASANVSTDGHQFTVHLDERLSDVAGKLQKNVGLDYSREKWWVSAAKLNDATSFIKACATEFLKCEVVKTRVILYGYEVRVCYWKDKQGEFHPNGVFPRGGSREGSWNKNDVPGNRNDGRTPYYSVGFAAVVFDKTINKRATGDTVLWEYVRDEKPEWLHSLNSFVRLEIDPHQYDYKEMPYTEEAAKFFYGVMINLCKLADQIQTFFGNEPALLKAISSGNLLTFK